jgi:uncharacterized protein DUF6064
MNMPFTPEQFFDVFGRYNAAVWPAQLLLVAMALAVVVLVIRGRVTEGRWVSLALALLWAWMALAYHFAFFASINPMAWAFAVMSLLAALWFVWTGVVQQRLHFGLRNDARGWLGGALIVFALLVYPAWGWLIGHRYPEIPTFGLPCPTTIFTIGVLLLAQGRAPASVFLVPVLWSLVGSSAAFALGVYQDLGLLVAGAIGLVAATHQGPFATDSARSARPA